MSPVVARRLRRALPLLVLLAATAFIVRIGYSAYTSVSRSFDAVPAAPLAATPEATGIPGLREVRFPRRADGQPVAGWFVPARNGAAVVIAHGSEADRTTMLAETRLLAAAGFGVLAFDWPGHGGSPGPNDWGVRDASALLGAVDWLTGPAGIDPARIGGYGFSMGGYLLARVAAGEPRLAAVVLAAPVPDLIGQLRYEHQRWGALGIAPALVALWRAGVPFEMPSALDAIPGIAPRPLLLIAGGEDRVVPPAQVGALFAAAGEPKALWVVPGAGHGDYGAVAGPAYAERVAGFYRCHLLADCRP